MEHSKDVLCGLWCVDDLIHVDVHIVVPKHFHADTADSMSNVQCRRLRVICRDVG